MDLERVVGVLVGIFRVHALGQRREAVGQFGVELLLLAFLGRELALAADVVECLVDVDIAGALVEQGASGIELGLHEGQHVVDGGELDDGLAELFALAGVGQAFVVGGL